MGGERFDQAIPESYLFGENPDLNWLGSKPIAVSETIPLKCHKFYNFLSPVPVSIFASKELWTDQDPQEPRQHSEGVGEVCEDRRRREKL